MHLLLFYYLLSPPPFTTTTQVLVKLISPYTRISLSYIANELNGIPESDVEDLLVSLILDKKIEARIDQVKGW